VGESGLVTAGKVPGEAAVMASYLGSCCFPDADPRTERIEN